MSLILYYWGQVTQKVEEVTLSRFVHAGHLPAGAAALRVARLRRAGAVAGVCGVVLSLVHVGQKCLNASAFPVYTVLQFVCTQLAAFPGPSPFPLSLQTAQPPPHRPNISGKRRTRALVCPFCATLTPTASLLQPLTNQQRRADTTAACRTALLCWSLAGPLRGALAAQQGLAEHYRWDWASAP